MKNSRRQKNQCSERIGRKCRLLYTRTEIKFRSCFKGFLFKKTVAVGVLKRIVLFQNFFYDFLKGDQFNILKVPEACFLFVLLLPISLNKSNLEDSSDFEQDEMLAIKFWNKIQFWPLLGVHRNKIIFIVKLLHVEHLKYLEIMVSLFRFKSSCSQMFFKIGVLKKFSIFAGKHLC